MDPKGNQTDPPPNCPFVPFDSALSASLPFPDPQRCMLNFWCLPPATYPNCGINPHAPPCNLPCLPEKIACSVETPDCPRPAYCSTPWGSV